MLKASNIITNYDNLLLELSPLNIRDIRDKTEEGLIVYAPELQFQIKNISGGNLVDIDVEVNYYDSNDTFIGTDSDLRTELLKNEEVETFSLFIEPPEKVKKAELNIQGRRQNIHDKFNTVLTHPIFWILIIGILIFAGIKD